ncbi:MAG: hypothetical protein ACRD5H_00065 [Nitrososphaerales archaeon]
MDERGVSTYYFLVCNQCKRRASFVGRWYPDRWRWMVGAKDRIPEYVALHQDHLEHTRIVSEHDSGGAVMDLEDADDK